MAGGAAFAQGFVFENKRAALFTMTLRAGFVEARHGEAAGGFHDFVAVRVVAVHAVHLAFDDGMMLRKTEFRMDVDMALETGGRIFAGIDDESAAAATDADVFAGRTVAGFATGYLGEFNVVLVEAAVSAGEEGARDIGVAIDARRVADEVRAWNVRRESHGLVQGGAGHEQDNEKRKAEAAGNPQKISVHLHSICAGITGWLRPALFFQRKKRRNPPAASGC
jgi:hypothetical protein